MYQSWKRAAACVVTTSIVLGGVGTAYAAKEIPYGPGYVNQTTEAPENSGENRAPQPEGSQTPIQEGEIASQAESTGGTSQTVEGNQENTGEPMADITFTPGQGDQITNYMMTLKNLKGGIAYRTYVNNGGFIQWVADGNPSGGTENSTYVEAIQIQLTGDAEKTHDVYYSATVDGIGKMGYAVNGEVAGTSEMGHHILSLEVVIVPKGSQAPSSGNLGHSARYITPVTSRINIAENGTTMTNEDGSPYNGWLDYDWRRYYFQDGKALTGWQYLDGYKFYFDSHGQLVQDLDELIGKQSRYVIRVNKTLNCLTVFAKDGDKGYIIPVKAMRTSVGDDTPLGTFYTPEKYRWRLMVNDSYTQYATRIIPGQGFLLHSITYATPNIYDLNTEGYNGLGVSRSLGCVRLTAANAKWIYDNCVLGTQIDIYEDGNVASPYYKPDLVPIPLDQKYDPTDPGVIQ